MLHLWSTMGPAQHNQLVLGHSKPANNRATHTRPSHASIECWSRIPGVSNYAGRVVSSPSGAVVVVAA